MNMNLCCLRGGSVRCPVGELFVHMCEWIEGEWGKES